MLSWKLLHSTFAGRIETMVVGFELLLKMLMKLIFVLFNVSIAKMTQEFIQGFETGILLREDSRAMRDYSCPRPEIENSLVQQASSMIAPMKMMAAMMKEKKLDKTVS
jgi:hypothetical protein